MLGLTFGESSPQGTILNAKTAEDVRGAVRVPFTQILPTTLKVSPLPPPLPLPLPSHRLIPHSLPALTKS